MQGVSSRTRSRNATRFQSLDDIIPYKRRKKALKNVQRKKAKHVVVDVEKGNKSDEVEGSDMFIRKGGTFFDDSRGSVAEKPIILDSDSDSESDDDNNDDHDVNVDDGDVNGGDVNGGDDDGDVNGGDGLCSSGDERGTSDDDGDGLCSSSDEKGTSDEDFEGSESSSSEESCSSYDDDDDEKEEEEEEEVMRKGKNEINGMRRCTKDGVSERNYEKVEDGDFKNSPLSVDDDECGVEDQEELKHAECATPSVSSSTLENTACSEKELWEEMDISLREAEEEIDSLLIGNIGINEPTPKKGGFYEKKSCIEKEVCFDSSKLYEGAEKKGIKRVKKEVESDDDVQVIGFTIPSEVKVQKNKKKKEYSLKSRQNVEPVLEEIRDSTKVQKSQRKIANANEEVNDSVEHDFRERKVHNVRSKAWKDREDDGDHNVKRGRPFKPKELRVMARLLAECYLDVKNSKKKESIEQKENDGADLHKVDARPPVCAETIWSLEEKPKPLEKSKTEMETDELWEQVKIYFKEEEVYPLIGNIGAKEVTPTSLCEHDFHFDEEIGDYCKRCGFVKTEIKNISPPVVDRFPYEGSGNRVSFSEVKGSFFDVSQLNDNDNDGDSEGFLSHKEGTVWDLIPDVKQSLYPHQQEGFEFIWKNLAGNIYFNKLESPNRCSEGGCIISHYPGTGKTRLTIMFLKTYLDLFPKSKCFPVIVAPACLLLTWEDEFKKWDIGVPFHNLNNPELSGKELREAVDSVDWSIITQRATKIRRMVKLYSWSKEKSILGISYNLYAQLAGSKIWKKNERCRKNDPKMKEINEFDLMGKVLRKVPRLLVLDEGHKPRNQRSGIWKVLTKVQAKKRIILSGTPFQNNFLELYNTLTLVKPSFSNTIPWELKKFCQNRQKQEKKLPEGWSWEPISSGKVTGNITDDKISQLKSLMESIVHVYQGAILKIKLPGLKECVLTLKPDSFQKEILDSIESSQKWVMFEHKLTLASVHPSLFLRCNDLTKKEESVLDKERLEKLRLDPRGGVKTRFLVEFVSLCDAVNEKVLVFSQFIDPLDLIIEQLKSKFYWSEGKEVLYMSGTVRPKMKQSLIRTFNDPNSEAKIMLASTKACNEGISLVGASRVVLLDVVWNPSVERQAISRAYRIGQKKIVYTYRLITEGTTEWAKYRKQAEKERLSELVFSDKDAAENDVPNSCAVNFEDQVLDKMIRHEKLKDMFGERVVEPNERDLFGSFGF